MVENIKLPHGGPKSAFVVMDLIDYINKSGRNYIIQGQRNCIFSDHPKPQSLDYWLRENYTHLKDTKQAVNEVVENLVSTGRFKAKKLECPNSGHYCKGIQLAKVVNNKADIKQLAHNNKRYIDIANHKHRILRAIQKNEWDFGNKILYDLCSNYPRHDKVGVVITKILFIGRIYAASIERRRNKNDSEINDNFYINTVAPKIMKSDLDYGLMKLSPEQKISDDNIYAILKLHKYLSDLFYELSRLYKRSLASKYLHFHKPELFFIYDSRAVSALRNFTSRFPTQYREIASSNDIDKDYAKFFLKALVVKKEIQVALGIKLTVRQFDKVLIDVANKGL